MADNSKYRDNEKALRGQTIRTETGRDRSDDADGVKDAIGADLPGDVGDLDHSIKNGKVPRD